MSNNINARELALKVLYKIEKEKAYSNIALDEELSKYICGHCGKLATKITSGWYYPLCDDCSKEVHSTFTDIANFYSFNSYDDIVAEVEHIKSNYRFGDYWQPLK